MLFTVTDKSGNKSLHWRENQEITGDIVTDGNGQRIGIMGGTFDPIHFGHLVAAEAARFQLNLDRVIFVPSGQPPHKKAVGVTPANHRLAMTNLAIADNCHFQSSQVELLRSGPSYTIDTVKYFLEQWPGAQIYFITGADVILELLTWKDAMGLLELCYFIAVTRPGYDLEQLKYLKDRLPSGLGEKIITLQVPGIAISSTELRQRVQLAEPIKYLVPEGVSAYINQHNLYQ